MGKSEDLSKAGEKLEALLHIYNDDIKAGLEAEIR